MAQYNSSIVIGPSGGILEINGYGFNKNATFYYSE
jgi:hypothetical protein